MSEISDQEIEALVKIGVQEAKLDILVKDFQKERHATTKSLDSLYRLFRTFPEKIAECQDEIEQNMERHYVTDSDLKLLEKDLKNDIYNIQRGFKWSLAVIVGGAGTIQFFMTIWWLGVKIGGAGG